tara:strand:+ start:3301 stop:3519 length:219 start_codon:yes stop_codon:yes gene_type:complete
MSRSRLYADGLGTNDLFLGDSAAIDAASLMKINPNQISTSTTLDSSKNALLVGPINVDSGVTITINGTLMVV